MNWFVERRELTEVVHTRSGLRIQDPSLERGVSGCHEVAGGTEHSWSEVTGDAVPAGLLPIEVTPRAREVLAPVPVLADRGEPATEAVRRLVDVARAAGAAHLDVLLREVDRRTLFASSGRQVEDHARYALLEVKAFHAGDGPPTDAWRSAAFPDVAHLRAALPSLEALVDGLVRELRETTPALPCPSGALSIVFPPGAASACFFHEVCGHPLEGDVVARGGSYLARRLGQRVAGEHLTVRDDPTDGHGALGFAWDDEGDAARPVALLREGVVDAPLLDARSALALGLAPNGHGRRVDFRHPPLPRMAHTRVEPHQGHLDALVADVSHGLLVQHLTPRQMDLLSGDFSFYIVEAREIRDGRVGRRVGPGILRGNGLEALAAIDAVGADARNLFATRGCRKLDHGPLPVSFGQPTVRFRQLTVGPWR
ncbi:TldD/PmbA family protein [Myxococcus sp. RHSTA-1-4]|uniref:TldD/PmbA family protein n=1 Tax=Myxococcus sp. RHSTA-1-4 TaxID=2874601 RepID=UPI001CC10B3B|nr:metallopeptidase TldD-related protein [Myxococcus sp. RHSTA-1-4]MBZ4418102.1 TldD/PmbA family protein [Myxococcus sp. RHSTA-1-4]